MVTVADCLKSWTATTLLAANATLSQQKAKQQEWQVLWLTPPASDNGVALQAYPLWRFDRCEERVQAAEDNLQRLQLLEGLLNVSLCVRSEPARTPSSSFRSRASTQP